MLCQLNSEGFIWQFQLQLHCISWSLDSRPIKHDHSTFSQMDGQDKTMPSHLTITWWWCHQITKAPVCCALSRVCFIISYMSVHLQIISFGYILLRKLIKTQCSFHLLVPLYFCLLYCSNLVHQLLFCFITQRCNLDPAKAPSWNEPKAFWGC